MLCSSLRALTGPHGQGEDIAGGRFDVRVVVLHVLSFLVLLGRRFFCSEKQKCIQVIDRSVTTLSKMVGTAVNMSTRSHQDKEDVRDTILFFTA